MGQKVNPISFRLGEFYTWNSLWYANKHDFKKILLEDIKIREYLMKRLTNAGITGVRIERSINKIRITIQVTRPGMVIGRGGSGLDELKKSLGLLISVPEPEKNLEIRPEEVKVPDLSALYVARWIAESLQKRMPFRQLLRKSGERTMAAGAKGIKIVLAGRINGAEIARRERFAKGKVPLQTLRAKIDYADYPSLTRSGYIGVKVWICTQE